MVTVFTILHLISCLALITIVVLQSGKKSGLSSVSGGSESYLSKNKNAGMDAFLARITKWVAIAFAAFTLILTIII